MPERLQLRRTRGWRKPEGAVVVSRPSKFGNPFVVRLEPGVLEPHDFGWYVGVHGTLERHSPIHVDHADAVRAVVATYERWLRGGNNYGFAALREQRTWVLDNLHNLAGRDLCCWCKPGDPCHADVLLAIVAEMPQQTAPGTREAANVPGDTPIVPFTQVAP